MLGRVAVRSLRQQPSSYLIQSRAGLTLPQLRTYARKPQRPSNAFQSGHQNASGDGAPRGPVPNRSFPPDNTRSTRKPSDDAAFEPEEDYADLEKSIPSRDSTSRPSRASKSSDADAFRELSSEAPSGQPTRPLPDLRQGIPSTLDAEYSDRPSPAAGTSREGETVGANITEDPAEGGSRTRPGPDSDLPKEAYVSSIDKRRNAVARYAYLGVFGFAIASAIWLGQRWTDEEEANNQANAQNGWSPGAVWSRIKLRTSRSLGYYTDPVAPKLLRDPDPTMMMPPYTLVLSLEDLLVNSKWSRQHGWQVAKRPGVDQFLRYLSQYYELVIFTSTPQYNSDQVIMKLDPFRLTQPIFRDGTTYVNGEHIKDLSYLGRDLAKVVIVDTVPAHVQYQPENAIVLPKWNGTREDPHANDLVALIPFLEYIAGLNIQDVRKVIKSFEGTHIPTEFAKREARAREQFNQKLAEERAKRGRLGSASQSIAGALGFKPGSQPVYVGEQSPAEAYAQGKMLTDQIRERGMRAYEAFDKDLRENGEKYLAEMAAEEKKQMNEFAKSMQGDVSSWGSLFLGGGGGGGGGNDQGKK